MLKTPNISKVSMCYIIYYLRSSKYVSFRVENKGKQRYFLQGYYLSTPVFTQ